MASPTTPTLSHHSKTDTAYKILYCLIAAWALAKLLSLLTRSIDIATSGFADFLYNYGGGFIRRGLSGEILFVVNDYLHIPPVVFCNTVSVLCCAVLAYFIVRHFNREGLSWYVLLGGFALGSISVYGIDFMRRDYMELALMLAILTLHRKMRFTPWLIAGNAIAIFALLLHEATFFFMIPILVLITNLRTRNILKASAAWLPAIAVFLICCLFKGNTDQQQSIIDAVNYHFPGLLDEENIPWALQFIGMDSSKVFKLHIDYNITAIPHRLPIPTLAFTLSLICYVFYMAIAMPLAFARKAIASETRNVLARILIIQLICLLPMFLLLSCDFSRICVYWVISSYIVYLSLPHDQIDCMFRPRYNRIINRICHWMFRILPPKKLVITILFLIIGHPHGTPIVTYHFELSYMNKFNSAIFEYG